MEASQEQMAAPQDAVRFVFRRDGENKYTAVYIITAFGPDRHTSYEISSAINFESLEDLKAKLNRRINALVLPKGWTCIKSVDDFFPTFNSIHREGINANWIFPIMPDYCVFEIVRRVRNPPTLMQKLFTRAFESTKNDVDNPDAPFVVPNERFDELPVAPPLYD